MSPLQVFRNLEIGTMLYYEMAKLSSLLSATTLRFLRPIIKVEFRYEKGHLPPCFGRFIDPDRTVMLLHGNEVRPTRAPNAVRRLAPPNCARAWRLVVPTG
jgi:hypothetical protein